MTCSISAGSMPGARDCVADRVGAEGRRCERSERSTQPAERRACGGEDDGRRHSPGYVPDVETGSLERGVAWVHTMRVVFLARLAFELDRDV